MHILVIRKFEIVIVVSLLVADFKIFNPSDLLARSVNDIDLWNLKQLKLTEIQYHREN